MTLKDRRGVNVPVPPTKTSNLLVAAQHQHAQTSLCTPTLAAVRAGRRTHTNAHRFLLRFGEWGEPSAMQAKETYHGQLTFYFPGGGL